MAFQLKRVLDTQQDFNDLIMRTRTAGLALIQAVFGVAAFSLTRDSFVVLGRLPIHVAAFIILFGLGMIFGLYRIDHKYYFRMLVASVAFGMKLERDAPTLPTLKSSPFGITTAITEAAEEAGPVWSWVRTNILRRPERKEVKPGASKMSVRLFYLVPAILGAVFFTVVLATVRPNCNWAEETGGVSVELRREVCGDEGKSDSNE